MPGPRPLAPPLRDFLVVAPAVDPEEDSGRLDDLDVPVTPPLMDALLEAVLIPVFFLWSFVDSGPEGRVLGYMYGACGGGGCP